MRYIFTANLVEECGWDEMKGDGEEKPRCEKRRWGKGVELGWSSH